MTAVRMRRVRSALALAAVGMVALAGCSSPGTMMTHAATSSATATASGGSMMGGAGAMSGYTLSGSTCTAPAATAATSGTVVSVVLSDMGLTTMMGGTAPMGAHMMLRATPTTVAAGAITLLATNRGWRTHELVLLPLAAGATAGQRTPGTDGKVEETGSLGEASAACAAGPGDGIPAGSASWVTLTLPAGRYELVCNLTNHYADGMRQEFDVT